MNLHVKSTTGRKADSYVYEREFELQLQPQVKRLGSLSDMYLR